MERILIAKPDITDLEIEYVNDAIRHGWGEKCYDYIKQFEKSFVQYIDVEYAMATSSCTGATHLALAALGVSEGDEVIVPDTAWIACAAAVTYVGAKPVFVDILPNTWCMDPTRIEEAITQRTKAIMPVHIYGSVAEMDEILAIARTHHLAVIEDAAQALGSEYKGKKTGSMGDCGVFSFHGTKTASTGEGGMFVTNDTKLYERICPLADQGRVPEETRVFFPHFIGYKYKISNLQAAMGCAQIVRAEELVDRKRQIFAWYKEFFDDVDEITMNCEPRYVKNSYWMPTVIFDKSLNINLNELMKYLREKNIDSRPFLYPLSSLPMFEEKPENTVAYDLYSRGINLPTHYGLSEKDVRTVANAIKTYIT